jgi:DNA-binding PadR family transcriptional regulator
MAFQHVILALLEGGPSHGWQMKGQIEAALGPEYGGLNKGYIYEVIHKMERDGLVTSRVEAQDGMRPDRSVLEVTDTGLEQLTEWLGEPVRRSAGFRDEFVQKVLAASLRGEDTVREVCRVQRRVLLSEAKALQTLRRERDSDAGASFTIEVAILRTNAELECVEAAEARAGQRLIELPSAELPGTGELPGETASAAAAVEGAAQSRARRRQARSERQTPAARQTRARGAGSAGAA